jgi:hypothetical protein
MHRATKFASAISVGVVASVPFATMSFTTLEAAEECLAKPREQTPAGQHWYYVVDPGSKRHCWHLLPETSSHAAMSRRARRAALVASRNSEPAMTHATRDARAEFEPPQGRDENAAQESQQTLVASDYPKGVVQDQLDNQPDGVAAATPQSLVASRWPEPAGAPATATERPPAPFVVASLTPDATPDAGSTDLTPKAPPVALTSAESSVLTNAETSVTGTSSSLETLLLATIGAMTLTGLAGSSVYLLARLRRPRLSHADLAPEHGWPPADPVDLTRLPRWLDPAASGSARERV